MKKYVPLIVVAVLTMIPVALMANSYLINGTVDLSKYIIPTISPALTGFIYLLQQKIKNGLDVFKIEITNDVGKVRDGFAELKHDTVELKTHIKEVKDNVELITMNYKMKKDFKLNLEYVANESISLLEDNKNLRTFATIKTKMFIDFICDLRECIDSMDEDLFQLKIEQYKCEIEDIKDEAYNMFHHEMVDDFYLRFGSINDKFISLLCKILIIQNTHTKNIYLDECSKFMRKFIFILDKVYIAHIDKKF